MSNFGMLVTEAKRPLTGDSGIHLPRIRAIGSRLSWLPAVMTSRIPASASGLNVSSASS